MVILKSKTFVGELADHYGFPSTEHAFITSSSSAYINEELFLAWVDEVLVPGVKARRRFLNLPTDSKALLILDGCHAHIPEKFQELSKVHIDHHFLVPHSSHLTQPLDWGIFSSFKKILPSTQSLDTNNKVGKWMMHGLASLQKSATFSSIQNSFYWAGTELNYDNGVPDIVVDVETWLVQKNSPESILKEEYFAMQQKRKRKRVNTTQNTMDTQ